MRRRMRFAMPLVMVTSCSQAAPAPLPVQPMGSEVGSEVAAAPVPIDAPDIDAPTDAATDAPIDAPAAPRPGQVVFWLTGRTEQPEGYVSCHNFGKGTRCNPPRPIRLPDERVVSHLLDIQQGPGSSLLITVGTGADHFETQPRSLRLRSPRPAGVTVTFRVVRVSRRTTILEVIGLDRATLEGGIELDVKYP